MRVSLGMPLHAGSRKVPRSVAARETIVADTPPGPLNQSLEIRLKAIAVLWGISPQGFGKRPASVA